MPGAVDDPLQIVERARFAASQATTLRAPWYQYTLGMAHFRAGQLEEAGQCFRDSLAAGWGRVFNWLGLALVHHQAGDLPKARECLAKAMDGVDKTTEHVFFARDWVEFELLQREARALIESTEEEADNGNRDNANSDREPHHPDADPLANESNGGSQSPSVSEQVD